MMGVVMRKKAWWPCVVFLSTCGAGIWISAQQRGQGAGQPIAIDADDIAGTVTSARGREAGVWVIAETTDSPTKLRKIVVTDDQGRYLIPDLPPKATYSIWTRGYGLVDSSPVRSAPGRRVALTGIVAPDERAAARIYPANYWYSLVEIPPERDFSRDGAERQRHRSRDEDAASLDQIKSRSTATSATSWATRRLARSRRPSAPSRRALDAGIVACRQDRTARG
jgi:hypothetical protein